MAVASDGLARRTSIRVVLMARLKQARGSPSRAMFNQRLTTRLRNVDFAPAARLRGARNPLKMGATLHARQMLHERHAWRRNSAMGCHDYSGTLASALIRVVMHSGHGRRSS